MSAKGRILVLLLGAVVVFASVIAVLLRLMPSPRKETDYLVIGAVATFATLLVLFLILVNTWVKKPDIFFKRRDRKD
jgi:amino acid transporter